MQNQLPQGILKLDQPLHADKDSAKASDAPHYHAQAAKLSQNASRQAMVTDKVYNKLDVLDQMVNAVKISEGLQQQIKTM